MADARIMAMGTGMTTSGTLVSPQRITQATRPRAEFGPNECSLSQGARTRLAEAPSVAPLLIRSLHPGAAPRCRPQCQAWFPLSVWVILASGGAQKPQTPRTSVQTGGPGMRR